MEARKITLLVLGVVALASVLCSPIIGGALLLVNACIRNQCLDKRLEMDRRVTATAVVNLMMYGIGGAIGMLGVATETALLFGACVTAFACLWPDDGFARHTVKSACTDVITTHSQWEIEGPDGTWRPL